MSENLYPEPLSKRLISVSEITLQVRKYYTKFTEEKLSKAAKGKNHTSSFKSRVCEQISRSSAVPPEIVLISDNMAVEGEQNELKCTATGLPKPTVIWKIGDQEYPNQEVSVFEPR